jgi:hypothetical protein
MADLDPLILGHDNSAQNWTTLRRTAPLNDDDPLEAVIIENPYGSGVLARRRSIPSGYGVGVEGVATSGPEPLRILVPF